MYKYISITEAHALDNYQLLFTYENGEKRKFDMAPYPEKGIFKQLKDPKMFKTAKPCFNSIAWDNNADIDPETLYEDSIKVDD